MVRARFSTGKQVALISNASNVSNVSNATDVADAANVNGMAPVHKEGQGRR